MGGAGMGSTVVRVHYPSAAASNMTIRGDGAGLDWMAGRPMVAAGTDLWEWRGDTTAPLEFKPLIGDQTWAVGANFKAQPGTTTEIYPFFQMGSGHLDAQMFTSTSLGNTRTVTTYLPPGYDENTTGTYRVVVMQDGHNLYDRNQTAFGVEWQVDETLDAGIATSEVEPIIVLGVEPTDRMAEYTPTPDPQYGGGQAATYVAMLETELLPWARARYRIKSGVRAGIGGSSLGGLFSTYACWERSSVFDNCFCMSSSYWWDSRRLLRTVMDSTAMPPIRVWLDSGDSGTSNDGLTDTLSMRDVLQMRGYRVGTDLFHYTGVGQEHNEAAWAARFPMAVRALYPGRALGGTN
jgi:predicted alpha/beta superfamily hydrolase